MRRFNSYQLESIDANVTLCLCELQFDKIFNCSFEHEARTNMAVFCVCKSRDPRPATQTGSFAEESCLLCCRLFFYETSRHYCKKFIFSVIKYPLEFSYVVFFIIYLMCLFIWNENVFGFIPDEKIRTILLVYNINRLLSFLIELQNIIVLDRLQ